VHFAEFFLILQRQTKKERIYMTEEEKKEYDEIMAGLKGSENEEEQILMDRFTFGDKEPTILLAFEAIINRSECCELRDDSLYVETEEAFDYVAKK
jgi:hypothetical protein